MTSKRLFLTLLCSAICAGPVSIASADIVIKTNKKGGADAEIREEMTQFGNNTSFTPVNPAHPLIPNPQGRRGSLTELASRIDSRVAPAVENPPVATRSDRSSFMLIRFNIRGITLAMAAASTGVDVRTTWHTTNLAQSQDTVANNSQGRLQYTYDPPPGGGANFDDTPKADDNGDEETRKIGFNYWVLKPGHAANSPAGKFIENGANLSGVTYYNAPGVLPDGNIGTIDVDPNQTVFLGNKKLPSIGLQNHLPVGGEFLFDLPSLKVALTNAILAGDTYLNVLVANDFDGNSNFSQFQNFNYVVNPKERTTLTADTGYDADVTVAGLQGTPISPAGGASNADGSFSPQLILRGALTPEPSSLALLGLASLASMSVMRRRLK